MQNTQIVDMKGFHSLVTNTENGTKHVNCSRLESPYCFHLIYSPLKKNIGDRKI